PVVVHVEPQRNLAQRVRRFARVARIGDPEFRPQADTRRHVVLEQPVDQEIAVELIIVGNECADLETDGFRSGMRLTPAIVLRRDVRRTESEDGERERSDEEFAHEPPPLIAAEECNGYSCRARRSRLTFGERSKDLDFWMER